MSGDTGPAHQAPGPGPDLRLCFCVRGREAGPGHGLRPGLTGAGHRTPQVEMAGASLGLGTEAPTSGREESRAAAETLATQAA